jgi:myo-inositol-1-phosphate synthase
MTTSSLFLNEPFKVESDRVEYTESHIQSLYEYDTVLVEDGKVRPRKTEVCFRTGRKVPRTGLMMVGWGGNNGTTVTAAILANQKGLRWKTKEGERGADYLGSVAMSSAVRLGGNASGKCVWAPFRNLLPMIHPNDLVLGGWDISNLSLAESMERAQVLEVTLQDQLKPLMKDLKPLPAIHNPEFIAANQDSRADNVLGGSPQEQVDTVRSHIRDFKAANHLDKVIVLWTANTERFAAIEEGINDTAANLLSSIAKSEVSHAWESRLGPVRSSANKPGCHPSCLP